ncbi:hypothetical protein V6Z11_A02G122100 [Gossypium hirsutum]
MSQKGCNGWLGLITDKLLVFTSRAGSFRIFDTNKF